MFLNLFSLITCFEFNILIFISPVLAELTESPIAQLVSQDVLFKTFLNLLFTLHVPLSRLHSILEKKKHSTQP